MQRGGLFAQPNIEQQIKDVFYNGLAEYVLLNGPVDRQNLSQKIQEGVMNILRQILQASAKYDGIRLPTNTIVTMDKCPERYQPLFEILIRLKDQTVNDKALAIVAGKIMALDSFRDMNLSQFLLEATGLTETVVAQIHYDEDGVTPQLIRDTFYNEMVNQAFLATDEKWLLLSVEDLVDEEAHIYWALPALTILEAIQQSQRCDGIRLLNDKVVHSQNCPPEENFPQLIAAILAVKAKVRALSPDELHFIKHKIASETELPDRLQQLPNQPVLQEIAAAIKGLAIQISQRRTFHQMVGRVVTACVEMRKPQIPEMRM